MSQSLEKIEQVEVRLEAKVDIRIEINSAHQDKAISYPLWPKWVKPGKVRHIKDLPVFAEVHDMILNGTPDAEVARFIHGAGLHIDEDPVTVIGWLSHYRATVPKALILVRTMPKAAIEAAKKVNSSLNIIAEADKLYDYQLKRVEKAIKRENEIDYIIPGGEKEIREASNLLKECARLRKEIGLTDRQLEEASKGSNQLERFDLNRVYSREGVNEKLRDPVSRLKILNAVEKMIDLVARRVETNPEPIEVGRQEADITQAETKNSTERTETPGLEVVSQVDLGTLDQLTAGDEP